MDEAQAIVNQHEQGEQSRITRLPAPPSSLPAAAKQGSSVPVRAAAAAVAGSFVAGAAVVGIVGHRHRRTPALRSKRRTSLTPRRRRADGRRSAVGEQLQIVASRKVLLDIHLLAGPGTDS